MIVNFYFDSEYPKDATDEQKTEIQMRIIRQVRDEFLKNCDWTQIPDAPVDKVAWATYRQQLRDLMATITPSYEIEFPDPPQ